VGVVRIAGRDACALPARAADTTPKILMLKPNLYANSFIRHTADTTGTLPAEPISALG